jgi:hypothetical protein
MYIGHIYGGGKISGIMFSFGSASLGPLEMFDSIWVRGVGGGWSRKKKVSTHGSGEPSTNVSKHFRTRSHTRKISLALRTASNHFSSGWGGGREASKKEAAESTETLHNFSSPAAAIFSLLLLSEAVFLTLLFMSISQITA